MTVKKEIFVLSLFVTRQIYMPIHSTVPNSTFHFRKQIYYPVKITSGNNQYAVLMSNGNVYLWNPPETYETTWTSKFSHKKPRLVWSANRSDMQCIDVAIGLDSALLILTKSEYCYMGLKRPEPKQKITKTITTEKYDVFFKFTKVTGVEHVINVSSGTSGGFAIIRR